MIRRAALAALLLCAGCSSARYDALEAQLIELRAEVHALRAELIERGEPIAPPPQPVAVTHEELAELLARIAALELRWQRLSTETGAPPPAPEPLTREPTIVLPQPGGRALPATGAPLEVLSVGAGDLLLARVGGHLERLTLSGVEAPRRREEYDQDPARRARHAQAFGESAVGSDQAWEGSRDFLFQQVQGKQFHLRYAQGRPQRTLDGSLPVVLRDGERDLNAELVAQGWGLALDTVYRAQEEAARQAKRGLFAPR